MKRKDFLLNATVAGGALLAAPQQLLTNNIRKQPIRMAHLTDIHVMRGIIPETGMAKALQHVQQLKEPVHFILNGGDAIMDALEADKSNTDEQFKLFLSLLKKENSLPVHHCIGNHDVWGWFIKNNKPEADKQYGKQWVLDVFEMKNRYYSFSKQNWYFIVLDSTQQNIAGGYVGKLDPEQMEWLKTELAKVPAGLFTCIISHIPILSICAGLFFNKTESNGDLLIKRNLMHTDFLELKKLFTANPHIKACISGHIHLQDEVTYLGVKYFCNSAVSGNWWKGDFQEFAPAYSIMEFFDDGGVRRTTHKY